MMYVVLWWLPIAAMLLALAVMMFWMWFHFPDRTPDDVVDFLQHIDLDKAEALVDPTEESSIRARLSPRNFRLVQRKRVYIYIELLKRMSHNAEILVDLGSREVETNAPHIAKAALALQHEAINVRIYAFTTLIKLRFWLLIRLHAWFMLPALSLCDAKETCGISGLESYDRLKTAASTLFLLLQNDRFEELMQSL